MYICSSLFTKASYNTIHWVVFQKRIFQFFFSNLGIFVLQDIFAVAVSLITGKIVYISDQAASILNCKRDVFKNAKFVEFLTPQDVSVFYSFTTQYRLPSWSMCTGAGTTHTHTHDQS